MDAIDVTLLEPQRKHPTVFETFDKLVGGQGFTILNDHDPKPLYYQMVAKLGEVFDWEYLQRGPEQWEVKITRLKAGEKPVSLGALVAKDHRRAAVFEKYDLDFCCGGKKTLHEACMDKGLDALKVEEELQQVEQKATEAEHGCNCWQLDVLADYIVNKHHTYVTTAIPELNALLSKLVEVHGQSNPELLQIKQVFSTIADELEGHMPREERVLFPYIKHLESVSAGEVELVPPPFGTIQNPVRMMEADHVQVGGDLEQVKTLTNNYTLPENACNTYAITYKKLQEFEQDLHAHIHLENNILFPKAIALETKLI